MSDGGSSAVADVPEKTGWSRDSVANTLTVSIGLSLVASILVASAAIALKPVQALNEARYRQQIILDVAGLYDPGADADALFATIDTRVVDLASGVYSTDVEADEFDAIAASKDPEFGISVPADADIANIKQRARHAVVYLVRDGNALDQVILPVYGAGLWSTMFGFLALDADGTTVRGLRFYEHAETPGLGDQIDKPAWRSLWPGKIIFGDGGQSQIEVIRGNVDPAASAAIHQVDGISGATLTGRGVTNLLRYWTGPDGFGPYLERLRSGDDT
jgi:Na+-transporting NADH:ubiquinone oxidoreductase subunit C